MALLVVGSFLLKEDKAVSNDLVEETIPSETLKNVEMAASEEDKTIETTIAEDKMEAEIKESPVRKLPKNREK